MFTCDFNNTVCLKGVRAKRKGRAGRIFGKLN
jgi:hypothetical protein